LPEGPHEAAPMRGMLERTQMAMTIYRPGDLYNKRGKRGIFNVGKSHFYDQIEPHLERVKLGEKAVGYTDRSVDREMERRIERTA
jgi:hypothetical protein